MSGEVLREEKSFGSIPERRPTRDERAQFGRAGGRAEVTDKPVAEKRDWSAALPAGLTLPVWRCRVCGYLCARDEPPEVCPVCKAEKDRFERFL